MLQNIPLEILKCFIFEGKYDVLFVFFFQKTSPLVCFVSIFFMSKYNALFYKPKQVDYFAFFFYFHE